MPDDTRARAAAAAMLVAVGCHACDGPKRGERGASTSVVERAAGGIREGAGAGAPRAGSASQHGDDRGDERDERDERDHDDDPYAARRDALVEELARDGIRDPRVLAAIGAVRRDKLVPDALVEHAYEDRPLPIGHEQTISQPYVVARMTELADVSPGERVLEIGTGSGYQAAVLAELGADVYSIEIVAPLAAQARRALDALGYGDRVHTKVGDGYRGWPEHAPFDAILLTAAPPEVPAPLEAQLAVGGRLVAPVGELEQELVVVRRTESGLERARSLPVRFVPMTGEAQRR